MMIKHANDTTVQATVIDADTIRYGGDAFKRERTCGEPRRFVPYDADNFGNPSFTELWCEHCDIELDPDWAFCPKCGARVESDA